MDIATGSGREMPSSPVCSRYAIRAVLLHSTANSASSVPNFSDVLNIGWSNYGCSTAQVPAHHLKRKSTAEHHAGSFGIDPHVVFGGRSDVPLATGRTAHNHAAGHIVNQVRRLRQCQRNIGERAEGDEQ